MKLHEMLHCNPMPEIFVKYILLLTRGSERKENEIQKSVKQKLGTALS